MTCCKSAICISPLSYLWTLSIFPSCLPRLPPTLFSRTTRAFVDVPLYFMPLRRSIPRWVFAYGLYIRTVYHPTFLPMLVDNSTLIESDVVNSFLYPCAGLSDPTRIHTIDRPRLCTIYIVIQPTRTRRDRRFWTGIRWLLLTKRVWSRCLVVRTGPLPQGRRVHTCGHTPRLDHAVFVVATSSMDDSDNDTMDARIKVFQTTTKVYI